MQTEKRNEGQKGSDMTVLATRKCVGGVAAFALAAASLSGCDSPERNQASRASSSSYESRAPGSEASPTNDASLQLFLADGPTRFASFQALFLKSGKQCAAVTKALLEGGVDGTDEWRIECSDSGAWEVWFPPAGAPEIDSCRAGGCA